jgi:septum formation protein
MPTTGVGMAPDSNKSIILTISQLVRGGVIAEISMNPSHPPLILASRSPRRRELLLEAGYAFEVVVPDDSAECGLCSGENPTQMVARLAYQKAANVAEKTKAGVVIGCDTVAECDGRILGKPPSIDHARQMLQTLSGREHRVLSGLCLWKIPGGRPLVRVATTLLRMDQLTVGQLDDYLAGGQWEGKAGAFGYQDRLGWVHIVEGSASNVVGLPMELLADMLEEASEENDE